MMVKDVTKFHKHHLVGWGMLECVCVCGTKFGVDVEGGIAHSN